MSVSSLSLPSPVLRISQNVWPPNRTSSDFKVKIKKEKRGRAGQSVVSPRPALRVVLGSFRNKLIICSAKYSFAPQHHFLPFASSFLIFFSAFLFLTSYFRHRNPIALSSAASIFACSGVSS